MCLFESRKRLTCCLSLCALLCTEQPLPWPKRLPDVVSDPFYAEFIMVLDYSSLFEVVLAANYLGIVPLLELGCARLGRLIQSLGS